MPVNSSTWKEIQEEQSKLAKNGLRRLIDGRELAEIVPKRGNAPSCFKQQLNTCERSCFACNTAITIVSGGWVGCFYCEETWGRIQRKIGPHAGVDSNLPLFRLQSRLQHIYHGQPYARVDLNPLPESTLSPSQGLRIWPQSVTSFFRKKIRYGRPGDGTFIKPGWPNDGVFICYEKLCREGFLFLPCNN